MADEAELAAAWRAGDMARVATAAVDGYGPEILGFLVAQLRDREDAQEVFSVFLEDFWRGLPGFRWECSLRAWAYRLARNAAHRFARSPRRRREQPLSWQRHGHLSGLVHRVRTETMQILRTETKDRMRALRERLPPEDQTILALRIDRELSWQELAVVMGEGELDADASKREGARLRKRFSLAKERLRQMAIDEGLLGEAPER